MEISGEVKYVIVIAMALVITAFIIAACMTVQSIERTRVLNSCFEKVENPADCVWFDKTDSAGNR